ncbi:MAG TPA: hypothetical protein VH678_27570 [Xanthobacteraceae bacterium]|jgi:hypothetical protein
MDDPLREIDDIAVRDAIDIFQTYIESTIGNLLDRDRNIALAQIETARSRAMQNVKEMASDVVPIEQEAKTLCLAIGLTGKDFRPAAQNLLAL